MRERRDLCLQPGNSGTHRADATGVTIDVRPVARGEVSEAALVLARAFAGDDISVASVARPTDPEPMLAALFESAIRRHYLRHGVVDVAVDRGRIVGAAVWAAPGQGDFAPTAYVQMFLDTVRTVPWRLLPLLVQLYRTGRVHPTPPHWYIYALGVAEPGGGVGGLLLDHGIARAGDVPCFLEASTPDSARLYARKGFLQIGTAPTPPGCRYPNQPQMWHDPVAHDERQPRSA